MQRFGNLNYLSWLPVVRNGFYVVGSLTANRFSCSRCIQYKGGFKCQQLTLFCAKTFQNDAINSQGMKLWFARPIKMVQSFTYSQQQNYIPNEFKKEKYPCCMKYPLIK